jgi:hypothetical protein
MEVMDILAEKLGPLLFQFGYFKRKAFIGVNNFLVESTSPVIRLIMSYVAFAGSENAPRREE